MLTAVTLPERALRLLRALRPAPLHVNLRERLRVLLGACLGMLCAGVASHAVLGSDLPWLVAPLGASAVLVFGLPASPLAQPWAVVGGNTVSALVAIGCVHWLALPAPLLAAAAVALAIGAMFTLRCLHPPGGSSALLMALTATQDWQFAFVPVALNSVLLALAGIAYNSLTGRRYPHAQKQPVPVGAPAQAPPRFGEAELDAVLARYNQVLDVPRDDLADLLHEAELLTYRNRLGGLSCADIMSSPVLSIGPDTPLEQAWALLQRHHIKALPVVDGERRVAGIVTRADYMQAVEAEEGLTGQLRALARFVRPARAAGLETVGQIMNRQVHTAGAERPIAELVPLFAATGHHHLPVVDAQARLVGILTQSDLVKALSHGH